MRLSPFWFALTLLTVGAFLTAWGPPEVERLERSLAAWEALKKANGDDYQYEVHFSAMTGGGGMTLLEVRDDKVVMRTFEARGVNGPTEQWTERGAKLGSHENAAPLRTVGELYEICREEVLTQDRTVYNLYLEFGDDGVLKECQYAYKPEDVGDAMASGVLISALRFLNEP